MNEIGLGGPNEGDEIAGYRLGELLVRNRATRVFLAEYDRTPTERVRCILRCVHVGVAPEGFADEFLRDAKTAGALDHPRLSRVLDFGQTEGVAYVATELVRGVDLLTVFGAAKRSAAPIPVEISLWIGHQICEALGALHSSSSQSALVHRNLALPNVMIDEEGSPRLLDFGVSGTEARRAASGEGDFVGRSEYASPEALEGRALDGRSDIFSLGVILHELLTGHRLFHKDGQKIERGGGAIPIELNPPSKIRRDLPPQIDSLVMTALEHDPSDRFDSAADMQAALSASLLGVPNEGRSLLAAFVKERFSGRADELLAPFSAPPSQPSSADAKEPDPVAEVAEFEPVAMQPNPRGGGSPPPKKKKKKSGIAAAAMAMWGAGLFTLLLAAMAGYFVWSESSRPAWWSLEAWKESQGGKMAEPEPILPPSSLPSRPEQTTEADEPETGPEARTRPARTGGQGRRSPAREKRQTVTKAPSAPAAISREGELVVVCPTGCTIYVDGIRMAPESPGGVLTVRAGERMLKVVDDSSRREVERRVLIAPGRVKVEEIRFSPTFLERTGTEDW